jgi:hypothetical protein
MRYMQNEELEIITLEELRVLTLEIISKRNFQKVLLSSLYRSLWENNVLGMFYKTIQLRIPIELFPEELFSRYETTILDFFVQVLERNFPGFVFDTESYFNGEIHNLVIKDDEEGLNCRRISDHFRIYISY